MKYLFSILLFISSTCFGQVETSDFTTYDTIYVDGIYSWNIRISRPVNMFTAGHPDTASRPAFITMQGAGEIGTNLTLIDNYGPHSWLNSGWDGSVVLSNGTHYPILITVMPRLNNGINYINPRAPQIHNLITHILNTYHIKRNSAHFAGLSMGAFSWGRYMVYEVSAGAETGMKNMTSLVFLQGQSTETFAPYNAWSLGASAYGHWAAKYGGTFMGLEGTADGRSVWIASENMNDSVPGSAYFSYENYGGGEHCCWNTFYDPSITDWTSTNDNIATGTHANTFGNYVKGSSIFQWMLRQGDTSMTVLDGNLYYNTPTNGKKMVGTGEYQMLFIDENQELWGLGNLSNIGVNGTGTVGVPQKVAVSPSGLKFNHVAGGLHGGGAIDTSGYVWIVGDNDQYQHGQGNNTNPVLAPEKILTDSAGNDFNMVRDLVGWFVKDGANGYNGFYAVKQDGTLWGWGRMFFGMRANGEYGADKSRPVQIVMPGDRRIAKIVAGQFAIALCTDGTVWTWGQGASANNLGIASATDTVKWYPRQLIGLSNIRTIAGGGNWNFAINTSNVLYGWGAYGEHLGNGAGTAVSTPTVMTAISAALPQPIQKIVVNSAAVHAILTDGSLYGWGDAAQGTVGDGQRINFSLDGGNPFDRGNLNVVTPVLIAPGVVFDTVFGASVYTYTSYARDTANNLYVWGRGKSAVIANQLRPASSGITASYGNSWDIKWPTPVDPFNIATSYISTSDYCVLNPAGSPCNQYPIPANTAPIANAGPTQNITTTSTTLNGGATDDVFVSRYEWTQISGPNTAVINLPASQDPTISGLINGTYVFQLLVEDNGWMTNTNTVTIIKGDTPSPVESSSFRLTVPRAAKIVRPY